MKGDITDSMVLAFKEKQDPKTIRQITEASHQPIQKVFQVLKNSQRGSSQFFQPSGNNLDGLPTYTLSDKGQEHLTKLLLLSSR